MEACSKSECKAAVEGFSLETNKEDYTLLKAEQLPPKCDLNHIKLKSTNLTEGKKHIRQVESALNFSNFSREGNEEELGRLSSNSLCSEVDMQFVNKAAKMNRWRNMEALNHSSSSMDMKVDFRDSPVEDSSNWVIGSESDTEAGEASEAAREKDDSDFVKRADVQQIEEDLNDVANKSFGLQKKLDDYEIVKGDGVCSLLPSPPPSLEYMGPADGITQEEKGDGMHEDLEWEYKLPAPPTGFEDEEERTAEEVKEDTWVAESASIPSTFSSSLQKVWVGEGEPSNHLPNFRMGTYKAASSEGWEDPRETNNEKLLDKRSGSMFAMLNSENIEREADREVDKNYLETWASVSTRSSVTSAPSSCVHAFNPTAHTNPGYKDGVREEKNGLAKNESYVVRVSSFGGKSSMNLKRSLSSTSSIFSRHNGVHGKDAAEKLDKESVASFTLRSNNGNEIRALSSRTVSLHDLAVNSAEEECKVAVSMVNGFHKENTTPKIVSSTWKKPQGGDHPGKCPPPVSHNLRKTSSELSISQASVVSGWKGADDEDQKVAKLQQQFLHWHEQMLQNRNALDGSVSLKSLQVLRGVLPQLKKSLSSDLADKAAAQKIPTKRKESDQGRTDCSEIMETNGDEGEILNSLSTTTESNYAPSSNHETSSMEAALQEAPKRYSYAGPPSINFGTWSERPKSEVSLKCDSDYRIGVGQAPRAKDTTVHIAHGKGNQSSQYEPTPPPKPSNHVVVNIVSATKQEPISRLPIVRSVELKKTSTLSRTDRPLSGSFLNDLREELTGALASLVDANRNGVAEEGNERKRRQQIPSSAVPPPPPDVTSVVRMPNQITSLRRMGSTAGVECGPRINGYGGIEKRHTLAPVVKGFRVNSVSATNVTNNQCQPPQPPPAPLPPPAVVCGVALKKKPEMSTIPKFTENPRDQLLMAIREFGGRESLKKTAINFK